MRPGADEDDRVGVPPAQVGVVEPAAQIVAGFVMGGERDPGRPQGRDRRVRQENSHLLPVGLVVVHACEGRPPVIHRVEEPVLQGDETPIAADPAVIRAAVRLGVSPVILLGRSRGAAGHPPAEQQRQPHHRVDEPAQQADRGEPATSSRQPGAARVTPPRAELSSAQRPLHETKRKTWPRFAHLGQATRRELSGRAKPLPGAGAAPSAFGAAPPQTAALQIALDRHRQEKLTLGKAQYRFVAAQQPQIVCRGHHSSVPC